MTDRAVTKQLAGGEDIVWGTGTVNQARPSGTLPITKVDASVVPYEGTTSLRTKLAKKPEVLENVLEMQTWPTNTAAEQYVYLLGYSTKGDGGGGLFWLDKLDTTSVEDLNLVFNPDVLANGRWKRVDKTKQISANHGDVDIALTVDSSGIHLFATNLTANRAAALPTTGLYKGLTFRVTRTDTGAYTLAIGSVVTLPTGGRKWVEVTYNGTAWIQSAAGSLI